MTVAVGAALVIGGVVATGGAVAAVGLAVGIAGIVMSALTNKTKGDAAPSSAETPDVPPPEDPYSPSGVDGPKAADAPAGTEEGPARETGYQGGTAQLVFEHTPGSPPNPRGLVEPKVYYVADDPQTTYDLNGRPRTPV